MKSSLTLAGESLESSVAKENLLEIIGDLSDSALEKLLDLGDALPIFSYLTKGLKTTIAIRDAIFLEKVVAFLQNVGKIPNDSRVKMISKIQNDEKYRNKFGKFSLIALDRFNDEYKAKYLGIAVQYLAREEIPFDFYKRFSHFLDSLTVDDLQQFTEETFLNFGRNTFYAFESLGLISISLKLPTENDRKSAWREDPNIIKVSRRSLTDWGHMTKNILLELPISIK
ncbi:hypothetical protein H8S90_10460 [Olivibacter sp. SDN3]|uniref:hypothetical protein n=1 Tax=Olivibacter sp. SDN3 TaxID=2764720 RepID=UPI001650DE55|nr:hypothetical protein [Olivibacter sp. SDN3]QNL51956.1 hypothetical protein H8S90_10460 [Olivibacter sp. SDN3]